MKMNDNVFKPVTASKDGLEYRYSVPESSSKMILLTIGDVAVMGNWAGELGQYYKAWCPLPKRDKVLEKQLFWGSA